MRALVTAGTVLTMLVLASAASARPVVSYSAATGVLVTGDASSEGITVNGALSSSEFFVSAGSFPARDGIQAAQPLAGPGCQQVDASRVRCVITGSGIVSANMGDGPDGVNAVGGRDLFLDGGAGDDLLIGDDGGDLIEGGLGNDTLRAGIDARNDDLRGGAGNDVLEGDRGGTNTLRGGEGNDTFRDQFHIAGASETRRSPDLVDGGPGIDTASYANRFAHESVALSIAPQATAADDGKEGEGDALVGIERAIGGDGDDTLRVSNSPFALTPRTVYGLGGGPGVDTLRVTGSIRASLDGGLGRDTIAGGPAEDFIFSREGEVDQLSCGGALDTVISDLVDPTPVDCESVNEGEVTEGRHVRFARVVRVRRNGTLVVRLRCPRVRGGCRGRIDGRVDRRGTAFGRDTRYRIRAGRSRKVTVRLPRSQVARARGRRARVRLRSIERGIHGRPRTTIRSLRARRA